MTLIRFEKFSTFCGINESTDDLYKMVNSVVFMEKKNFHKSDSFTTHERSEIIRILKERGERRNRDIRWSFSSDYVEIYTGNTDIEICKFDDQWFTVLVEDKWKSRNFYVCDTNEGLYSFLKKEWY